MKKRRRRRRNRIDFRVVAVIALAVLCAVGICAGILFAMSKFINKEKESASEVIEMLETEGDSEEEIVIEDTEIYEEEDPQSEDNVVSEETGAISITQYSEIKRNVTAETLREQLSALHNKTTEGKRFRLWKGREKDETKTDR